MKTRKIPMRTCVVTKEKLPKGELIRIVKTDDGVIYDLTGKVNGHGAYLKKDKDVFLKAKKSKVLNKYLETDIPDNFFDELNNIL